MYTFDKEKHEHRWDGRPVLSVTQIEEAIGITDMSAIPAERLEVAKVLGTAVHDATWFDDEGQLDPASIDAEVMPYLQQWRAFKRVFSVEIIHAEKGGYHEKYGYAGCVDRIGTMRFSGVPRTVVLDIKTAVKSKATGIQTAAYKELALSNGWISTRDRALTVAVYLRKDRYEVVEYKNPTDFNVFLSALNVVKWKMENL